MRLVKPNDDDAAAVDRLCTITRIIRGRIQDKIRRSSVCGENAQEVLSLVPVASLPDGSSVRARGPTVEFMAPPHDLLAQLKAERDDLQARQVHAQRLATMELPEALACSIARLAEIRSEVKENGTATVDLSELGCIVLEQDRIDCEIQSTENELALLNGLLSTRDESKYVLTRRCVYACLEFGIYEDLQDRNATILLEPPMARTKKTRPGHLALLCARNNTAAPK